MIDEILQFIGGLEWQNHKPDRTDKILNAITHYLIIASAGYLTGQAICIIFDIGIIGKQWRQEQRAISNREINTTHCSTQHSLAPTHRVPE